MKINDEGQRLLVNLAQHYEVWLDASRVLAKGRLQWKTVAGKDYLYRIVDSRVRGQILKGLKDAVTRRSGSHM